jgi:hypothetical protein
MLIILYVRVADRLKHSRGGGVMAFVMRRSSVCAQEDEDAHADSHQDSCDHRSINGSKTIAFLPDVVLLTLTFY